MYIPLSDKLTAWISDRTDGPNPERDAALSSLGDWIRARHTAGEPAPLIWVCTHNSRRSHLAQAWAQAAATHLGLTTVRSFSGGTETTRVHPRVLSTLQTDGFEVGTSRVGAPGPGNLIHSIQVGPKGPTIEAWSKEFTDPANPQADFAAIMVCSSADDACPFVPGAQIRISLPFEDPKVADGTPEEAEAYLAASHIIGFQIARAFARATSSE